MRHRAGILAGFTLSLAATAATRATTLYQAGAGVDPSSAGWLAYNDNIPGVDYFASTPAGTTLDTTTTPGNPIQAGWSNYAPNGTPINPAFPTLDRSAGFGVTVTMKLDAEATADANRAGFSIILLGSDHKGVELGFSHVPNEPTYEVWAQNDGPIATTLFTKGETANLSTPGTLTTYTLFIVGDAYSFGTASTTLLSGTVRDYGNWPNPPDPFADPYELGSYLFVGDDTTDARGAVTFSQIILVPEPAGLAALMFGTLILRRPLRDSACLT